MAALASAVEENKNNYGVSSNHRFNVYPKRKVIKYTKLRDSDSNEPWVTNNYPQHPRQRCIARFQEVEASSIAPKPIFTGKLMSSSFTRRKIVAISEDDENDLHPKFYASETLPSAKSNFSNKKEVKKSKFTANNKSPKNMHSSVNKNKIQNKEKDLKVASKVLMHQTYISKSPVSRKANEIETLFSKNDPKVSLKRTLLRKKTDQIPRYKKSSPKMNSRSSVLYMSVERQPTIIHVPLEPKYRTPNHDVHAHNVISLPSFCVVKKKDRATVMEDDLNRTDVNVGTDPPPPEKNQTTDMENPEHKSITKLEENYNGDGLTHHSNIDQLFDCLEIPNVTLTKDKTDPFKHEMVNFCSKSMSNLSLTPPSVTHKVNNLEKNSGLCKSSPYIIGKATLTYTTERKFNFHVVGSEKEDRILNFSPKIHLAYPLSVLSIFNNEIKNSDMSDIITVEKKRSASHDEFTNCLNELKSLNCSYVFNSHKLVKPSDIIRTLKVNSGLFVNDYISEQFQRELNFIDSFFESLQFLDSCSLAEKCLEESKVENWARETGCDARNSKYGSFFTTIENGAHSDVNETMVSKSLCLLNLLIRDEQRRARNLLFVLKMREAALKDFTKSQILWLENKKKQDNTDIPTLKKKQRGALLKLQHECGEMQRMRKALLSLSEKRKMALMKTKKNIELKLTNQVQVNHLLLGKKKLKRNQPSLDRNLAPLKCFDLSSSGCEETSKIQCEIFMDPTSVASSEKCVQTGDSILGSLLVNKTSDAAAEDFVAVDGGYLNIIFHNLSLPRIFSSGKHYEVNEKALMNIVKSANSLHKFTESDVVNKLAHEERNQDLDQSSSPSTARSLVDEFDQYYKSLAEEDKSGSGSEKDLVQQINDSNTDISVYHDTCSSNDLLEQASSTVTDFVAETETMEQKQAGPLPVPAGAAAGEVQQADNDATWNNQMSTTALSDGSPPCTMPSLCSVSSTSLVEAEELRRQQVAIEREIKALEQQQCQLLVVREIPDKPPPPYTPPSDARPKITQMFQPDQLTQQTICAFIKEGREPHCEDPFDMFLKDYCDDTVKKLSSQRNDQPWDSCDLPPQKPTVDDDGLVDKISENLKEVLTVVSNTVFSGHIDDILFAEWRRCEPEWTALHIDEAVVKNQIFESIFQRTLSETVDQYKKIVLNTD